MITPTAEKVLYMTDAGMVWEPRWHAKSELTGEEFTFATYKGAAFWLQQISDRLEATARRKGMTVEEVVKREAETGQRPLI